MKKIYALLGAALMAGTAMAAAPKLDMAKVNAAANQTLTLSAEAQAQLRAEMAYAGYQVENGISDSNEFARKSWTDGSGKVWNLSLKYTGEWSDMFTSWDSAPLYAKVLMTCTTSDATNQNRTQYQGLFFYPYQQFFIEMATDSDAVKKKLQQDLGDSFNPKALMPLEKMTPSYQIFSNFIHSFLVPQASDSENNFYIGMTKNTDGNYEFVWLNTATYMSKANNTYYYQYVGYGCNYVVTSGTAKYYGPTQGTGVKFTNFDNETQSINAAMKGGLTQTPNGATLVPFELNYAGEAEFLGLSSGQKRTFTIGEMHIVNTGQKDYDSWDKYDVEFGPLTRFETLFCGTTLTFPASGFKTQTIPTLPSYTNENYVVDWGRAVFYSPANTENPYGMWEEMYIIRNQNNMSENAPAANSFIEYALNMNQSVFPWSTPDGTFVYFNNDRTNYPVENIQENGAPGYKPYAFCGTNLGFGLQGVDFYNTTAYFNYQGDIIYHYDSKDYTKTRTISANGTTDVKIPENYVSVKGVASEVANAAIAIENGKVIINLDEAANVAVYNAAGMMVKNIKAAAGTTTLELGNGLFIVKAGKKVAKVML